MIRRTVTAFCAALLLSAGSFAQIRIDGAITMTDGISLETTIVKPSGAAPAEGFPGIVLVHGFGGNKDQMLTISLLLAARGYASVTYSVRGQGGSGGLSSVMGARERQDLFEVIQYFRSAADIDPNRLGVTGASQGGIHSWMAAVYRMPGVLAVAPLLATPDFARALAPNGCVRYGLTYEMSLASVRYGTDRDRVKGFIIADRHDSLLAYINARDLAHMIDSIEVPVFQELGWADYLFPVNGGIDAAAVLSARGIPVRSYYGTNGHGEPLNSQEAAFQVEQTIQWFDRWLKGIPLSQELHPLVIYADDRPNWPHHVVTGWPPTPHHAARLYLTRDGLSPLPPATEGSFPYSLDCDPTYTPEMAWNDRYAGSRFTSAFSSSPLRFVSYPLLDSVEITGMPSGAIHVSSDARKFQTHVRLYDVNGSTWTLMSRSSNGIRENQAGQTHQIEFEATALSHIVPAGHSIGVEIASLDMLRPDQANTVPFFLTSHSALLSTVQSPSYVDIPIVGSTTISAVLETAERAGPDFRLEQNYPNPFNPLTTVRYTIAGTRDQGTGASDVKLTVFDILGREVAVLVNERKPAGKYEVNFDASGLASGMYMYRLTAGNVVETKKMMLIK